MLPDWFLGASVAALYAIVISVGKWLVSRSISQSEDIEKMKVSIQSLGEIAEAVKQMKDDLSAHYQEDVKTTVSFLAFKEAYEKRSVIIDEIHMMLRKLSGN